MIYRYPVRVATEGGEVGLVFPDFPEIVSWHPSGTGEAERRD